MLGTLSTYRVQGTPDGAINRRGVHMSVVATSYGLRRLTGRSSRRYVIVGRVTALVMNQVGAAGHVQIVEVVVPTPRAANALLDLLPTTSLSVSCAFSLLFLVWSHLPAKKLAAAQPAAESSDQDRETNSGP